jgi:DNA polymerase III subunit gamma/tau
MADLHTKHRPSSLEEMVGQAHIVKSMRGVLKKKSCRAFVFTGPSGTGKTTLGRIVASMVGCNKNNIMEIDAATHTGVDDMRSLTENIHLSAFGDSPGKVFIIDEVQMLSKAAWNSLLKDIEEPPPHVWWVLCTTEPGKIPETIKTRCACYHLVPVTPEELNDLLAKVCEAEKMEVSEEVLYYIAEKSDGSPRRALTYLAACAECKSRKDAKLVIQSADNEEGGVIELCRALAKGTDWAGAMGIVRGMTENPESIRIVVCNYFAKMAMNAKGGMANKALAVLDAFSEPYPTQSGMTPVLLSLGRLLLQE